MKNFINTIGFTKTGKYIKENVIEKAKKMITTKDSGFNAIIVEMLLAVVAIVVILIFKTGTVEIVGTVFQNVKTAITNMMA